MSYDGFNWICLSNHCKESDTISRSGGVRSLLHLRSLPVCSIERLVDVPSGVIYDLLLTKDYYLIDRPLFDREHRAASAASVGRVDLSRLSAGLGPSPLLLQQGTTLGQLLPQSRCSR